VSAGVCFLSVFTLVLAFFVPGRGWWFAAGLALGAVLLAAAWLRRALKSESRYRRTTR